MAGEIFGTDVLVQNSLGDIVGQGSITHTFGGTPVEISNKSFGDNITYLDGALSAKQHVFSGDFTYNNGASFRKILADAETGAQDTYTLIYPGSGAVTEESVTGLFVATGMSRTSPHGEKVTVTMSFNSSGAVTRVGAAD